MVFKEISKVTDISYLFNRCRNLTDINDMDKLNVSNVTNMAGLFNGCVKLKYPKEINSWNTQNVRDMSIVFQNCKSIQKIGFGWKMENLIKMNLQVLPGNFRSISTGFNNILLIFSNSLILN